MQVLSLIIASGISLSGISLGSALHAAETPSAAAQNAEAKVVNLAEHPEIDSDTTKAFTEVLNSDATKVVIPDRGKPYIVGPVVVTNGSKEIVLEPGVMILAKPGAYKAKMACLLRFENAKNIVLRGNKATIRMNRTEYLGDDHQPSEHRHAVAIAACNGVLIEDLNVEESGGDGVYISGAYYHKEPVPEGSIKVSWKGKEGPVTRWELPVSYNVTVRRVVADRNHRQGLSLISGVNVLIEDCLFKNTSGTPPMHGLDIEPGNLRNQLKNVVVRNCVSEMNDGAGFMVYLRKLKETSEPVDVRFEGCEVRGSKGAGLIVGAIGDRDDEGVTAHITFKDCKVMDTEKAGIYVYDKSFKTGEVIFENVHLRNVATSDTAGLSSPEAAQEVNPRRSPPVAPIVFYLRRQSNLTNHFGGVTFKNCRVEDDKERPVIAQTANVGVPDIRISNLQGTIFTSQKNPVMKLGEYTSDVTLKLISE